MAITLQIPDLGTGPDTPTAETEYSAKQKLIANDMAIRDAMLPLTSAGAAGLALLGTASPTAIRAFMGEQLVSGVPIGDLTRAMVDLGTGSVIVPDEAASDIFMVSLSANVALELPANRQAGRRFSVALVQDASGSRTISFAPGYRFAAGSDKALSTTAGAIDLLECLDLGATLGVFCTLRKALDVPSDNPVQANLLTKQAFTDASFSKLNVSAPAANTLLETAVTDQHGVDFPTIAKPASAIRYRFYADFEPTLGRGWTMIQVFSSNYASMAMAYFNLTGGTTGYVTSSGSWTTTAPSARIQPLPSGKVRATLDFTTATETGMIPRIRICTGDGGETYAGDTTKGIKASNMWLYNPTAAAGA